MGSLQFVVFWDKRILDWDFEENYDIEFRLAILLSHIYKCPPKADTQKIRHM